MRHEEHGARERRERIALNEARFREMNETLRVAGRPRPERESRLQVVCECGTGDCTLLIDVSLDDYQAVREHPRRYLVLPGHVFDEVERVVAEVPGAEVVEKFEVAPGA
jgi:hypothetical protein